jgi:transposase
MAKEKKVLHTKEFKEEAVRLTVTSGKAISQVTKDLGISLNTLYGWRTQAREERRLPISETETPEQKIKRLERELRMVTEERDIIKKVLPTALRRPSAR